MNQTTWSNSGGFDHGSAEETADMGSHRILTVSKGCVTVTAPQAAIPPAMKALSQRQICR